MAMLRTVVCVFLAFAFACVSACGGAAPPADKSAVTPAAAPAPPKVNPDDFMKALENAEDDAKLKEMATLEPSLATYVRASDKETGLHVAAGNGATETVKVLLANGAVVDAVDAYSNTPLLNAAMNGWDDVVVLLLDKGASVTAVDAQGRTPVHLAATNGHGNIISLLLAKGASLTTKDSAGKLPIDLARESKKTDVLGLLKAK